MKKQDDVPLYSSRITNTYVEYLQKFYPEINVDDIFEHAVQENNICSGTDRRIGVCPGRRPGEAGVNTDELCPFFSCLHDPLEAYRVVFGSIAAHHHNYISISDVYPVVCHCTATKRLCQSRYRCGVSYSGLVFYVDEPQ